MIKMSILFSLIGTNPAIESNTFVAHINNNYISHEYCQKAIPKNVIQIIKEEFDKTGKSYDWKIALCIEVENFVKEVFEKFVKKLVSDKIVDSYDNYELTTILLTQVVDVDKTPTFEESYKKLVGIDKK